MTESPIRTSTGDIGCPRCETNLKIKKAPFFLSEEYVGHFESLVCPICNYFVLTSKGYEDAISEARKYGLVGPAEIKESDNVVEERLTIRLNTSSTNFSHGKLIDKSTEDEPLEAYTLPQEIIIPEVSIHRPTKSQLIKQLR